MSSFSTLSQLLSSLDLQSHPFLFIYEGGGGGDEHRKGNTNAIDREKPATVLGVAAVVVFTIMSPQEEEAKESVARKLACCILTALASSARM